MANSEDPLGSWAKQRGYRFGMAGIELLEEVQPDLESRRDRGEIDAFFSQDQLESFSYLRVCSLASPRSIILLAVPRPAHILTFSLGEKRFDTILPPTYVRYRPTFEDVRDDLQEALAGTRFRVELLNTPLKALANRLGVTRYGRNNVGYIEGLGSYFQLVGLVSDMPVPPETGSPLSGYHLLPRCLKCRICLAACPLGAIPEDRFLLHAEKCYTLLSESLNPIPESIKPPSPQCLVGCLRCQELCPENKGLLKYEKTETAFSGQETAAFLKEAAESNKAWEMVQAKFNTLGLSEDIRIFARNLRRMPGFNFRE